MNAWKIKKCVRNGFNYSQTQSFLIIFLKVRFCEKATKFEKPPIWNKIICSVKLKRPSHNIQDTFKLLFLILMLIYFSLGFSVSNRVCRKIAKLWISSRLSVEDWQFSCLFERQFAIQSSRNNWTLIQWPFSPKKVEKTSKNRLL